MAAKRASGDGARRAIQMNLFHPNAMNPADDVARSRKSAAEIEAHNLSAQLQPLFVKKHDATRLHYDLRLGYNGVLISFVLPDGPSYCPTDECRAIQMEDHRREYAGFEGVLPKGSYGAGVVMLWDRGMWKPCPGYSDVHACLHNGFLKLALYGEKLRGDWTLARVQGNRSRPGTVWKFMKEPDAYARSKDAQSILDAQPDSVSTGRTLEEIERD